MLLLKRIPWPLPVACLLVAGLLLLAACPAEEEVPPPTPPPPAPPAETPAAAVIVDVSLDEWTVTPAQGTVAAGTVTFRVANDGAIPHNFLVIRTDLAPEALPKTDAQVDEGQVDVVASIQEFAGGQTEEVTGDLEPGSYVLICNVVGHYDLGMWVAFTVE